MAITDKEKGVWGLDQVYNKINQGSIWEYNAPSGVNALFSWGYTRYGQINNNRGMDEEVSSPTQITGSWSKVSSGKDDTAAIKTDGTLWVWGRNNYGQLGQNAIASNPDHGISSPVQVPGTNWVEVQSAWNAILAKKTDGTLWTWGNGWGGVSGQNSSTLDRVSSPVQIGSDTTWNKINRTPNAAYAIKTDGTLWAWGINSDGRLGQNNTTQYSSPVQIPGTTWSKVAGGNNQGMATKTDGTLWMWGNNHMGGLGQNQNDWPSRRSSPTQIPGSTWNNIDSGNYCSYATKTDGTLWAWGVNAQGNLGQNDVVHYSSPVQIPGTTWVYPVAIFNSLFAVKTDGTLWATGRNALGQLGLNSSQSPANHGLSSPVQVPGVWPTDVGLWHGSSRGYHINAFKKD